ncbi:hypothetical protein M0802_006130 [Mischocyttarus mexicanus]|nr:hypothetical protein M0802_006130 [Mischocyttarus mexicanus]
MANSRVFVHVSLIIVIFLSVVWNESYLVKADSNIISTEENITDEEKLMVECKDSDYRTYIQCLKHQSYKGNKVKRHHPDITTEIDHDCMDTCVKGCRVSTAHDCNSKCSHCIRRKKQRTQIITEYETECTDADCHKNADKPSIVGMANFTTNMIINNNIQTNTSNSSIHPPVQPTHPPVQPTYPTDNCNCSCCYTCACPQSCCSSYDDHYPHGGHYGGFSGGFSGGLQLSLVPQLTLGLGLSQSYGCAYPYHWFCNHHNYQHTSGIDCSGCHHPVYRHRCHSSCHGHDLYGSRMKREDQPCKSPHCVGGI